MRRIGASIERIASQHERGLSTDDSRGERWARLRSLRRLNIVAPEISAVVEDVYELSVENDLLREENKRLREALYIDPKTGLHSDRYFEQFIYPELEERLTFLRDPIDRRGNDLQLVFGRADINAMNLINEDLSHEGGDRVIKEIAAALQSSIRSTDWVGRYGEAADEFSILLRVPNPVDGLQAASAFRDRFNERIAQIKGVKRPLSVSFGFVVIDNTYQTALQAMEAADTVMYDEKNTWKAMMRAQGKIVSNRLGEE